MSKGSQSDGVTKLTQFQEFMYILVKLRTSVVANEELCYRLKVAATTYPEFY